MVNTPASGEQSRTTDAEKTTTPPEGGEKTPPVAETETMTISKDELTRLRNKIGATERLLDEARGKEAARDQKEQLEALVLQVAEAQKVDPNLLMEIAPKMTKEELENFAKKLSKTGEKSGLGTPTLKLPMKPYSGLTSGGAIDFSKLSPAEKIAYGLSHKK